MATITESLSDDISAGDAVSYHLTMLSSITETINFSDAIIAVRMALLSDTIVFDDEALYAVNKIVTIIETILLSDEPVTQLESVAVLSDIIAFADEVRKGLSATITDTMSLSEEATHKLIALSTLLDTIIFGDEIGELSFRVVLTDSMTMGDEVTHQAIFKSIITDGLSFIGSVNFSGDAESQYLAYTLNTQSLGITEYTNFEFNSFAFPLAAASDGIYLLEGTNDEGADIDASIKTGLMDFGTSLRKQIPYAYLAIGEEGRLLFKTITVTRGVKEEHWYEANPANEATDTLRVPLGRGVKSKYWQFELANIEGEDFDIESMEVLPVVLKRRNG